MAKWTQGASGQAPRNYGLPVGLILLPVGVTLAVIALVAGLQTLVGVGIAAAVAGLISMVGGLVTLHRVRAKEKGSGSVIDSGTNLGSSHS